MAAIVVLRVQAPDPTSAALIVPLAVAGAGNGLVIAPNQDFVLREVPRDQAGTAGGLPQTSQRAPSASTSCWC